MTKTNQTPVYRADLQAATLMMSWLQGDGLPVKMVPDVTSEPLQSPAAHNVKSRYTLYVLLVPEEDKERAEELVEAYLAQGDRGGS